MSHLLLRSTTLALVGALAAIATLGAGCTGAPTPAPTPTPVTNAVDIDLAPPANPTLGFQQSTPRFPVPSGTEVQNCYFFDVPYDQEIYVNRFEMAQTPGTHHMNIFRVKTIVNLGGQPGDVVYGTSDNPGPCFDSANWADWPLVTNNEESINTAPTDFTLPSGVAEQFAPHELLMLQVHYVNARSQLTPWEGHVEVNFDRVDPSQVTAQLGTLFATDQNIKACPGDVDKSFTATCRFARSPVTIIAANGHFHSRGVQFTMNAWDPTNGGGAQFYLSNSWSSPPFDTDLHVAIPENGGIQYTCEYTVPSDTCGDPTDDCCFTFGPHSPTQEHCNAFVYFYPMVSTDINCF